MRSTTHKSIFLTQSPLPASKFSLLHFFRIFVMCWKFVSGSVVFLLLHSCFTNAALRLVNATALRLVSYRVKYQAVESILCDDVLLHLQGYKAPVNTSTSDSTARCNEQGTQAEESDSSPLQPGRPTTREVVSRLRCLENYLL
jgi:hypothetical protein